MSTTVDLYCNAERCVVGTVAGEPGSAISAAAVRASFAPAAIAASRLACRR